MSTIKEYVLEQFALEEMRDICTIGMVGGFGNLIYYADTCAFHDKYEDEIWYLLEADREEMGCKSVLEVLAGFNGAKNVGSMMQLKNLLCWYAVEKVCGELLEENYAKQNEANV